MKKLVLALAVFAAPLQAEDLRIATGGHFPPYIFDPMTTQVRGFDKDLMDEICARGDFDCTWVDLPMGDIFQALARGEVDIVTGGFGYSNERDTIVDFTCPYVVSNGSSGEFITMSRDVDLIEGRIGALDQSLYLSAMQQVGRDVRAYGTEAAALDALAAGDIDAVFGSHNMVDVATSQPGYFSAGTHPTFSGGTVLGVSEDAPQLRVRLNAILADLAEEGVLADIQLRWLGEVRGDGSDICYNNVGLT